MASFHFDLEIFCDINGESLANWSIHKLLEYSQSDKVDHAVRNWSISEFLLIAVGLLESNIS